MDFIKKLENKLSEVFKGLPPVPESAKKFLAEYAWIFALLGAVFGAIASLLLLTGVLFATAVVTPAYTNSIYATGAVDVKHYVALAWIALIAVVVSTIISILAVSGLKAKQRKGWDLLFLGAVVSVVYNVFFWLQSPSAVFSFVWSLLVSAVGFYLLFQIREKFSSKSSSPAA